MIGEPTLDLTKSDYLLGKLMALAIVDSSERNVPEDADNHGREHEHAYQHIHQWPHEENARIHALTEKRRKAHVTDEPGNIRREGQGTVKHTDNNQILMVHQDIDHKEEPKGRHNHEAQVPHEVDPVPNVAPPRTRVITEAQCQFGR